jgi:hypothetical protein
LEHQPLASPDSQGDSQNLSDPILARLVQAWPTSSEDRKKIFRALEILIAENSPSQTEQLKNNSPLLGTNAAKTLFSKTNGYPATLLRERFNNVAYN